MLRRSLRLRTLYRPRSQTGAGHSPRNHPFCRKTRCAATRDSARKPRVIALVGTPQAVLAATLMADKAARIFAAVGTTPSFLSPAQVARIAGRPDNITGATDPQLHVSRGFTVRVLADDRLQIDHFARNDGDMLFSGVAWGLTCAVPDKDSTYHIPLGDGSRWDTATIVAFRT